MVTRDRSARASVVPSGVPEHEVGSLQLWDGGQDTRRQALDWRFLNAGHEEQDRTIDALARPRVR